MSIPDLRMRVARPPYSSDSPAVDIIIFLTPEGLPLGSGWPMDAGL